MNLSPTLTAIIETLGRVKRLRRRLKKAESELAATRKMVDTFADQSAILGQEVDSLEASLNQAKQRVAELEGQRSVDGLIMEGMQRNFSVLKTQGDSLIAQNVKQKTVALHGASNGEMQ